MGDRLFVSTHKGLFEFRRSGAGRWQIARESFLGDPVPIVLAGSGGDDVYASIKHEHFGSKLHRSTDGGATWAECELPAYPPLPEGREPDRCPMRGIEIPWRLEMIWALERGGRDEDGVLWAGTLPGGLFRSEDHGRSWQLIESLWNVPQRAKWMGGGYDYAGIHSVCVDPRDAKKVAVGVSCGEAWQTGDGGETWRQCAHGMRAAYLPPEQALDPDFQDPHRMVQCPGEPDKYCVEHHCGIFRCVDDSHSWTEIEKAGPSTFGFAVAAHPQHGDTAWFVPAVSDEKRVPVDGKIVVTRTRDGGKSFDVLTDGLPQEHAYDITFRHGLDVDESGDRIAFGSTTGSLWLSENQGDAFECLSRHLPPVLCVRFA